MANNVYAVDATWSSIEKFSVTNPNIIILDDNYNPVISGTLKSITLCANRTRNNKVVSGGGTTFAAGRITSPNAIDIYFEIYGDKYAVSETKTLNNETKPVNPVILFSNSGYSAYAKAVTPYTINFGEGYALTANTKINLRCRGVNANSKDATVLSIWRRSGQKVGNRTLRWIGTADISTGPINPTNISITSNKTTITDLSGVEPNNTNNVKLGPTTTATVEAANGELTTLSLSDSRNLLNLSYNIYDKTHATVYIKAKNSNTSNVTTKLNVKSNGDRTASLDVYFPEKIQKVSLDNYNRVQNIKQVVDNENKLFHLNTDYPSYKTSQIQKLLLNKGNFTISNNRYLVPGEKEKTTLQSESKLFPMSADNTPISLLWRFYNNEVQKYNSNSNEGNYKQDLNTTFTCTIKPNTMSNFSYSWNKAEIPNILLFNQESPFINKLEYKNNDPYGGYCRGFRVDAIPDIGDKVITKYYNTDTGIYENNIFSELFQDKTLSGFYSIKITAYFYYDNNSSKYYDGVSVLIPQKVLLISDEELLPELVFPDLTETKNMMLTATERYGYSFEDILVDNQFSLGAVFGLFVGGIKISMTGENLKYFSSNNITKHLIFNIGKFVAEHENLPDELNVNPYVEISIGTYNKTIEYKTGMSKSVNVVTDISKLWKRPEIKQGEKITYYDYENCKKYMNKYEYLTPFTTEKERDRFELGLSEILVQQHILENEKNFFGTMQGEIINTAFWNIIADVLSEYSDNMQKWATDVINVSVWALPQFKHKKGEIITNNNLYQNYWDLLEQFNTNFTIHGEENGSDFPAVRLKNESGGEPVKYTHKELNELDGLGYTHNEIMNQFRRKR